MQGAGAAWDGTSAGGVPVRGLLPGLSPSDRCHHPSRCGFTSGSILLDYDGTGTADSEWCLVAGRCHPGGGVGRLAPSPAHPAGLGGFSLPPLSKLGQLFCSAACGPGLAWCSDGLGGILWAACPPVRRLPRLSPMCHLTSLFSPPEPQAGLLATALHVALSCPYLIIPHHGDFLGVSKPLH